MYGWVALKSRVTIEGVYLKLPAGAVAALGQALIPYYTGQIIDYASIDQSFDGFQWTCLLLVAVAFGTAVFTGGLLPCQRVQCYLWTVVLCGAEQPCLSFPATADRPHCLCPPSCPQPIGHIYSYAQASEEACSPSQ